MARRLIVDTGVLIAAERGRHQLEESIDADDDLVIAAITVAELRTGVELATDSRRDSRAAFVRQVLETLPVEPYDVTTAEAHALLLAHVRRVGRPRGAHDLIIAATALSTGRTVLTTDADAAFGDLPGVKCVVIA